MNTLRFSITLLAALSSATVVSAEKFVVHEWGVQILGKTARETVLTAPSELISGLPAFVGRNPTPLKFEAHGWDKPVIHLYGADGLEVSVSIGTPLGIPLAFYPPPELEKAEIWALSQKRMMGGKLHFSSGMKWRGRLRAAAPGNLAEPRANHWWHTARSIPSAYFQTAAGSERFVFYEATAAQEPVITAKVGEFALELTNSHDHAVGPVVILCNDGNGLRGVERATISSKAVAAIAKAELQEWTAEKTHAVCRKQWRALGMTEAEAKAIVEIWSSDLVSRLGVMVIAPMPEELYNKMFPIEITPKPDELVRAGLVFDTLAGQGARRSWLPGLAAALRAHGKDLASDDFATRTAAHSAFRAAGDLALGVLANLSSSDDPEVRRTARELTTEIKSASQLQPDTVRPTKENAASLVEWLYPPRAESRLPVPDPN